jgi:hypothetical protein
MRGIFEIFPINIYIYDIRKPEISGISALKIGKTIGPEMLKVRILNS